MPKDVYYFSHDSNARRDPKILAMRNEYGVEGYGRYWMIIETLSEQAGYKLEHKKWTLSGLAMDMQCDVNSLESFIESLIKDFELLESDGEFFWSDSLLRRMEFKDEKKKRRSEAGKKAAATRWGNGKEKPSDTKGNNANAMPIDAVASSRNAIHAKGKESKGKESKVNQRKVNQSKEEIRDSHSVVVFFQQNGFGSYTQFIAEDVTYWINDFIELGSSETEANELILQALKIAVEKNARSWKFAKGVLKNWIEKSLKNLDMVQANEKDFHTKKDNVGFEVEDDNLPF